MAKFNAKIQNRFETKNYEGAKAFSYPNQERELYAIAATTIFGDTFYQTWDEREKRLKELVASCSYEFVADLAYFLRKDMHLRSIPLWLLWEKSNSGRIKKEDVARTIQRADEILELLALYQSSIGGLKKLPIAR